MSQAAETAAHYCRGYDLALRSEVLDGGLWADISAQKRHFSRKLREAQDGLLEVLKHDNAQVCRLRLGHAEGSGYVAGRLYLWHGQCNGDVKLTDTITLLPTWEANECFDRHFVQL